MGFPWAPFIAIWLWNKWKSLRPIYCTFFAHKLNWQEERTQHNTQRSGPNWIFGQASQIKNEYGLDAHNRMVMKKSKKGEEEEASQMRVWESLPKPAWESWKHEPLTNTEQSQSSAQLSSTRLGPARLTPKTTTITKSNIVSGFQDRAQVHSLTRLLLIARCGIAYIY